MKKHILFFSLFALILFPIVASAQDNRMGFRGWGPRMGLTVDPDQFHFGAHADFGYLAERLRFQPNFELGIGDDMTVGAANFEVNYRFRDNWDVWTPYFGGGIGIMFVDRDTRGFGDGSSSDVGASILGGIEKSISSGNRFFLESKLRLVDAPDVKITMGWTFGH